MTDEAFVWAAFAAMAIIAVWLVGIAFCMALVRRDRRDTSDTQRRAKTWRWRLKLAVAWPYWFCGIMYWEARRRITRLRKRR